MKKLKICHLYPDVLNLYGDRGNVTAIKKRLEWRSIESEIINANIGDKTDLSDCDIFFIGGGQDFEQEVLLKDIAAGKGRAITDAIESGKVFLAICAGYQILGKYYKTHTGEVYNFIGALDLYTVGQKKRMIGNYAYECEIDGKKTEIVGFENHSGKTYLGEGVRPFGKILYGNGNNSQDKTEGARYKNVYATYAHGPVLPKNPAFTDELIRTALKNKYGDDALEAIDDTFENNAHDYMVRRLLNK